MKAINWSTVFILFIISFFIYLLSKKRNDDKQLERDHVVLCATITSAKGIGGTKSSAINYNFIFKGHKYENTNTCEQSSIDKFDAELTKMLVVVSKANPYNCQLLENKEDYEKYQITTEDTAGVICPPEDWHPGLP